MMAISGFMQVPDIDGEAKREGHEDWIEVYTMEQAIEQKGSGTVGSGLTTGESELTDLFIGKFVDKATPYLYLASLQGTNFDEVTIAFQKPSGEGFMDYLVYTLKECIVSSYSIYADPEESRFREKIGLNCNEVKFVYTEQAEDNTPGDEHEVTWNFETGTSP